MFFACPNRSSLASDFPKGRFGGRVEYEQRQNGVMEKWSAGFLWPHFSISPITQHPVLGCFPRDQEIRASGKSAWGSLCPGTIGPGREATVLDQDHAVISACGNSNDIG
jgi:hypothetical protein